MSHVPPEPATPPESARAPRRRSRRIDAHFLPPLPQSRGRTAGAGVAAGTHGPAQTRRSVIIEIVVVFAVTLGLSGLRSAVTLVEAQILSARAGESLASRQVTVAPSLSRLDGIDLARQLLAVTSGLAWGALGLYLLWRAGASLREHLGVERGRIGQDLAGGVGLAALIGLPGLALYLASHAMGFSLTVAASTMTDTWWRAPVSVLIALENGFLEEVLVVGYLVIRLRQLALRPWTVIAVSAVLRGSYHLYQGWGGFVGNIAMGIVFAYVFLRWRRLGPLVVAHVLIDVVAIVGYPLLAGSVDWLP